MSFHVNIAPFMSTMAFFTYKKENYNKNMFHTAILNDLINISHGSPVTHIF